MGHQRNDQSTREQIAKGTPGILESISFLEYIAIDPKPTFVIDAYAKSIVHENPAFQSWRHVRSTACAHAIQPALSDWITSLTCETMVAQHSFGGRAWTTTLCKGRWIVVSSHGYETHSGPTGSTGQIVAVHNAIPPQPKLRTQSEQSASTERSAQSIETLEKRSPHALWSKRSSPSYTSMMSNSPKSFDWTRTHVPGLSSHIQLIKNHAWEKTPLGLMDDWSDVFRQLVTTMMSNSDPRILVWGPERTMIYNESCVPLFGMKHPRALGARAEDVWSEAWSAFQPLFCLAETEGKATKISKMPLTLSRHGYDEETFWKVNLIPILGPEGNYLGAIDEFIEITQSVLQERRRDFIIKLNTAVTQANRISDIWAEVLTISKQNRDDLLYTMIYTPDLAEASSEAAYRHNTPSEPVHQFVLHGSAGIKSGVTGPLVAFDLNSETDQNSLASACQKAWKSSKVVVLQSKDGAIPPDLVTTAGAVSSSTTVSTVCVLPVADFLGNHQLAFVVIGLNPSRAFDTETAAFVSCLGDLLTRAISAVFLPEEQRLSRQRLEDIEASLAQQLRATSLEVERIETRYAKMFQMAPVGMYAIRPESGHVFYNEAYLSITGLTKEFVDDPKRDPLEIIHEQDSERLLNLWLQCLEDKQPFTAEYRVKRTWSGVDHFSGEKVTGETWIYAIAAPELDEQGNVLHIMGWLLDISDRRYHETLMINRAGNQHAEERFKQMAETAPLGMYRLKPDGTPTYLNDAYFDLLGFNRDEFYVAQKGGVGWADRIYEEDRPRVTEAWKNLSEFGVSLNLEYRVKKPWKSYDSATKTEMTGPTWLQGTAVAEKDESGNIVAVQGFVTEISLKKFSERLLAERLEEALENKRQADRFIDMTSHEMRNPLSAILQSADSILSALGSEDPAAQLLPGDIPPHLDDELVRTLVDSAQTIVLCAQHQKRIVDDILTLSKLDSNLLVICPDRVSMPTLIEKCFRMYESELERADIQASLDVQQSYHDLAVEDVMLDSSRVLQVIINLLTNAIKFTQHEDRRCINVILGASNTPPESGNHKAHFIAPRTGRPDHTTNPEWGSGDKVYLQISVEDSGRGISSEELKLLFHRFAQASPKTYKQYGGSGLGLFISRELTELQGGQIGVWSEAGKGSTFAFYVKARRCVLEDEPTVNDREVIQATRTPSLPRSRRNSISTTGSARSNWSTDQAPTRKLSQALRRPPLSRQVSMSALANLHILVVEDNLINQKVMQSQLKRLGCHVHVANHGVEALHFLRKTIFWNKESSILPHTPMEEFFHEPIPLAAVLMDLEMPILGGLECVKQIRDLQAQGQIISHIPVIAITANARNEQIAVAKDHGMDSVVTKPFRITELVPQIEAQIRRSRL